MLYLLYGPDRYRLHERVETLRRTYRQKNPEALGETLLDGTAPISLLREGFVSGGGLFEKKRFVVVRDAFLTHGEALITLLDTLALHNRTDTNTVFVENEGSTKTGFSELVDRCKTDVFENLPLQKVRTWILAYVAKEGIPKKPKRITDDALHLLGTLGPDLWRIAQELEKLMAYAAGNDAITEQDVRALVVFPEHGEVFRIFDGIAERRPIAALETVAHLTADGRGAEGLASYAITEARNLVRAVSAKTAHPRERAEEVFGVKPTVWRRRVLQARQWSEEDAKTLLRNALTLDLSWKSGSDARLALERFILSVPRRA